MLKQNCEMQNNNRINTGQLNKIIYTIRINEARKIDNNKNQF